MQKRRRMTSPEERDELWRRWRAGERITDIATALGRNAGSLYGHLYASGGIEPRQRTRCVRSLACREREIISRGLATGVSLRKIAVSLGRSPSTISREVARNGGRSSYRAADADARAWETARRPQKCKLGRNARLRRLVAVKLGRNWSPETGRRMVAPLLPDGCGHADLSRDNISLAVHSGSWGSEAGAYQAFT